MGEHLKKRRLELHLMQTGVARHLKVNFLSVQNWERGIHEPIIRFIPRIIAFLSYDPEPEPAKHDLPRRIAYARRRLGLTQEELARRLKTKCLNLISWEHGKSEPPPAKLAKIQMMLGDRFALWPNG